MVAKPTFGFWEKKLKPDGTFDEYKALLVVKGFRKRDKYRLLRYSFTSH